jgi:TnpA family transposase
MTRHSLNSRLSLFTLSEYHDFYDAPLFDATEQLHFFAFNEQDKAFLQSLSSVEDKVYVALLLGYFRAKHCLVVFRHYHSIADRQFIMAHYFAHEKTPKKLPSDTQQIRLQNKLLSHENYQRCDSVLQKTLLVYLSQAILQHPKVKLLFHALLDHLAQHCIALPAYSTLQKLMTQALSIERERLSKLYHQIFSSYEKAQLNELLQREETLSRLHNFKKDPKGFNYTEMRLEIKKHDLLKPLYHMAQAYLPRSSLPQETIRYYGSLVIFYNVYKLKRMNPAQAHLYCLCYSHSRYQHVNDNLFQFFNYYVNCYDAQARTKNQEKLGELKLEMREILDKTADVLGLILTPPYNNSVSKRKSFSLLSKDKLHSVQLYLKGELQDDGLFYWEHIDTLAFQIKRNLTSLFQVIDFTAKEKNRLTPLIAFFREQLQKNDEAIPLTPLLKKWISVSMMPYLMINEVTLHKTRALFYFYKSLAHHIKTGQVYLKHSIEHQALSDELIPVAEWQVNSTAILQALGYPKLMIPIDTLLTHYKEDLHTLFIEVNQRIKEGENPFVKIKTVKGQSVWTLPYEKKTDLANNPFFKQLPSTNIIDILHQVNAHCHFLDKLTPIQSHSIKVPRSDDLKLGAIFANAIRMGSYKMAQASDLSYNELLTTEKTYLRLETLSAATELINNEMAKLPIFKAWNLNGTLHGSVDGSKIGTRLETLKSRYSLKYFGLYKGVSAYNFSVNHLSAALRLIGTNEHESHFLYDVIANNTSDIQPQSVSGDGHSINRLNFTLLDMIDRGFMPCFPRINQQALYCFGELDTYNECIIKPSHTFNEALIKREWSNVQHILASILGGDTSQSTMVKKLSSHDFISSTKEALWEYDHILETFYILLYVDDITVRQAVRGALNRGEAYHQLCRAIAMLSGGRFRGSSEHELEVWNECARLVASAIIYYNAQLLSSLYEQAGTEEERSMIAQLSPIAWAHINLLGRYTFNHLLEKLDFKALVKELVLNFKEDIG